MTTVAVVLLPSEGYTGLAHWSASKLVPADVDEIVTHDEVPGYRRLKVDPNDDFFKQVNNALTSEWVLFLHPGEYLAPVGHESRHEIATFGGEVADSDLRALKEHLDSVPVEVNRIAQILIEQDDLEYRHVDLGLTPYPLTHPCYRLVRRSWLLDTTGFIFERLIGFKTPGTPPNLVDQTVPLLAGRAILHLGKVSWDVLHNRPLCAMDTFRTLQISTALERRAFLQAQDKIRLSRAMEAFKVLFEYYSTQEELWRLSRWMGEFLPYFLEESPQMETFRAQLEKQVAHLGNFSEEAISKWYATGSPDKTSTPEFLATPVASPRLLWLVQQCREKGLKKVIEFGSVDGMDLFTLQKIAPDIEWHGVEVSKQAVANGLEAAKRTGQKINLHHVESFYTAGQLFAGQFDGVSLFEVLEHNVDLHPLSAARTAVKHGGWVFITTPCGSWSTWDDKTMNVDIPKDHINAYTVKRMTKVLRSWLHVTNPTLEVIEVGNPNYWENNSWVFAKFRVGG